MTTAAASSLQEISHQSTVTLHHHHLGSLTTTHLKNDGNLFSTYSSMSGGGGDNSTQDLILYATTSSSSHDNNNDGTSSMDFLLDEDDGDIIDGQNAGSSSGESICNLLDDEGLGASLDGAGEISPSTSHSTLGRNDSGVFSCDTSPRSIRLGNLNLPSPSPNMTASTTTEMMATTAATNSTSSSSSPSTSTTQIPNCLPPFNTSNNNNNSKLVSPTIASSKTTTGESNKSKKVHRPKTSSPNRQGPQECSVCSKIFSNASALTKHKLTHSDERKHICSICAKAFKRQDHLNGHMLTHRNKKPYECTAKGCGKSYCDARSLRRHLETRHVESRHEIRATMALASSAALNSKTGSSTDSSSSESHTNDSQQKQPKNVKLIRSQSTSSNDIMLNAMDYHDHNNLLIDDADMENCSSLLGLSDSDLLNSQFESPLEGVVNCCIDDSNSAQIDLDFMKLESDGKMASILKVIENNNNTDCQNTMILVNNNNHIIPTTISNGQELQKICISPTTMRTTQSQLHQLLTQRVSNGAAASTNNNSKITVSSTSLVTPGVPNNKQAAVISPTTSSATRAGEQSQTSGSNWATNEKVLNKPGPVKAPKSSAKKSRGQGGGLKNSINTTDGSSSMPAFNEQHLAIIKIIQQQQQETSNLEASKASMPTSTRKTNANKAPKKAKVCSSPISKNGSPSSISDDALNKDDMPVQCSKCLRRFKNTPALNGHMRLHGGFYNKKEPDGRKKDHHSHHHKDNSTLTTPLQTASISVRALIGEKINQKRNTSSSSLNGALGIEKPVIPATTNINEVSTSSTPKIRQNGFILSQRTMGEESRNHQYLQEKSPLPISLNLNAYSSGSPEELLIKQEIQEHHQSEMFPFICEDEHGNATEQLLQEELFNKVSSICPEFLVGIEESILCSAGESTNSTQGNINDEKLSPEWKWSTVPTNGVVVDVGNAVNFLFNSSSNCSSSSTNTTNSEFYSKVGNGNGGPFTPLHPLDPVYPSPTPQSPSLHSQDSPSFIYPTPPASLESHNLQSPLFPFPSSTTPTSGTTSIPCTTQLSTCKHNTTLIFPFEAQMNTSLIPKTQAQQEQQQIDIMLQNLENGMLSTNSSMTDSEEIVLVYTTAPTCSNDIGQSILFSSSMATVAESSTTVMTSPHEIVSTGDAGLNTNRRNHNSNNNNKNSNNRIKVRSYSGSSTGESTNFLTPSSSPSLASNSSSGTTCSWSTTEDSVQSIKELKVNEVNRMDYAVIGGDGEEKFLNPNSVSVASPGLKSPKSKHIRNTFASNLRPQHILSSSSNNSSHFTPYPILNPVRPGAGLYWPFSPKLSHVNETKREVPRINVGTSFQVAEDLLGQEIQKNWETILPDHGSASPEDFHEQKLWDPQTLENCSEEDLNLYLQLACTDAVPGGGRNLEYAHHLLALCNGDTYKAALLIMNPEPVIPDYLKNYNYTDIQRWTTQELNTFQNSLLTVGKDFSQVAKLIGTKTVEDCISFYYQGWKKTFELEYKQLKDVMKKRESEFTLDLLKNVPPPLNYNSLFNSTLANNSGLLLDSSNVVSAKIKKEDSADTVAHVHEEYPCRLCGKVFNKVKSRSAHMKSHRPVDTSQQNGDSNSTAPQNKKSKLNGSLMSSSPSSIAQNYNSMPQLISPISPGATSLSPIPPASSPALGFSSNASPSTSAITTKCTTLEPEIVTNGSSSKPHDT